MTQKLSKTFLYRIRFTNRQELLVVGVVVVVEWGGVGVSFQGKQ